jgi:hypothetical protein
MKRAVDHFEPLLTRFAVCPIDTTSPAPSLFIVAGTMHALAHLYFYPASRTSLGGTDSPFQLETACVFTWLVHHPSLRQDTPDPLTLLALADAAEEVGCADAEVLTHLDPTPCHVGSGRDNSDEHSRHSPHGEQL